MLELPRLASTDLSRPEDPGALDGQNRVMARSLGALFLGGGALGFAWLALPHPAAANEASWPTRSWSWRWGAYC